MLKLTKLKTKKENLRLKAQQNNLLLKAQQNTISKNILYKKFLGSLIKKGNKIAAARILREAFLKASKKTKFPIYRIFNRIFKGLDTFVEVKKVTKRKNTHCIPFPVKKNRNQFLKVK
jgi:ribosomal protein S7